MPITWLCVPPFCAAMYMTIVYLHNNFGVVLTLTCLVAMFSSATRNEYTKQALVISSGRREERQGTTIIMIIEYVAAE